MKKNIIYIVTIIVLVDVGFLLKEDFFFFSIYDNYYIIPYYTITTLIAGILFLTLTLKLIKKKSFDKNITK